MRDAIIDFETYRWEKEVFNEILAKKLEEVKAPGNYKKPEAIQKYLDEEKPRVEAAFREKAALDPLTGRLLAASIAVERAEPGDTIDDRWDFYFILAKTEDEEATLIGEVDKKLSESRAGRIVSFYGRDFDIPFYVGRAIINNVPLKFAMPSYKYDKMHADMQDALPKGRLDYWLCATGFQRKEGSGADIDGWVKEENWDAIQKYCLDIKGAAALWERIRRVVRFK